MIPMSQYSLTQLENMAKAQDNDIAIELIQRFDDAWGRQNDITPEHEIEEREQSKHDEGVEEGRSFGRDEGKQEVLDAIQSYLESLDFTEENINTFISQVKERI